MIRCLLEYMCADRVVHYNTLTQSMPGLRRIHGAACARFRAARTIKDHENHTVRYIDEYKILESLLMPQTRHESHPKTKNSLSVIPYKRELERLLSLHKSRNTSVRPTYTTIDGPKTSREPPKHALKDKIDKLVCAPSLTSKDIDNFLQIHIISEKNLLAVQAELETVILLMIHNASPNSLMAIMQYIAKLWQTGIMGDSIFIRVARQQAISVLERSMEILKPTTYDYSYGKVVPLLGITDLERFDRMLENLFFYLDLRRPAAPELDPLDDKLLQLVARSGDMDEAMDRLQLVLNEGRHISSETTQVFLKSLSVFIEAQRKVFNGTANDFRAKIRGELMPLRGLFDAPDITQGTVLFCLKWLENLDEFYSLLEQVKASPFAASIWKECQVEMLETFLELHHTSYKSMQPHVVAEALHCQAQLFGLLDRFSSESELRLETLEKAVLACARGGNISGVTQLLNKLMNLKDSRNQRVLGLLLDQFPLQNKFPGMGAQEQAHELLVSIKRHLSKEELPKYIGALQRSDAVELLRHEGQRFTSESELVRGPVICALVAAFTHCGLHESALDVLRHSLDVGPRGEVVQQLLQAEILVREEVLSVAATHSQSHEWSQHDLEMAFGDVPGGRDAIEEFSR